MIKIEKNPRFFIPQQFINICKHLPLAVLANLFYGFPAKKMKIIGVTGTDGKTTTVNLIHHILSKSGYKSAMVSTVCAKIGDEEIDTGFHVTAPNPRLLQKLLLKMVDSGTEVAVLEATSHGLDQFRLWGIDFEITVLTNITHEHIDYHGSFENYRSSKLKLLEKSKTVVLNKDDRSYDYLDTKIRRYGDTKIVTYGLKSGADFTPQKFPFKTNLLGEYNRYNCLAAIGAAISLGVDKEKVLSAISSFAGVKGRLEEIKNGRGVKIIVDFAHTPNALEQILKLLQERKQKGKKLIVVFGAAGLRDKAKRPLMGEIAGKYADFSVITAEDPRTEDVSEICRQITQGCLSVNAREINVTKQFSIGNQFVTRKGMGNYFTIITDRQEAINFAVNNLAEKADTVVICGKGHEKSMCFGTTEYQWSDQEAVRKALNI